MKIYILLLFSFAFLTNVFAGKNVDLSFPAASVVSVIVFNQKQLPLVKGERSGRSATTPTKHSGFGFRNKKEVQINRLHVYKEKIDAAYLEKKALSEKKEKEQEKIDQLYEFLKAPQMILPDCFMDQMYSFNAK